ncbi:SDR family NAD(P)-dependent oxidoreductase [Streptomyces sp. NPDC020766]|uniref:SDR family NAD(P)-dependent oxidoreductase n=1 Tax=Streptomyces sp. NPDC020766 TaxID=3155011 RepID=UPI0033CE7692
MSSVTARIRRSFDVRQRSAHFLPAYVEQLNAHRLGARFVQLDVTDEASMSNAPATIDSAEGRLDVLVNNAGVLGSEVLNGPEPHRGQRFEQPRVVLGGEQPRPAGVQHAPSSSTRLNPAPPPPT